MKKTKNSLIIFVLLLILCLNLALAVPFSYQENKLTSISSSLPEKTKTAPKDSKITGPVVEAAFKSSSSLPWSAGSSVSSGISTTQDQNIFSSSFHSSDLFTGAAVYTRLIDVPPGINGFSPAINIYYNHHAASKASEVGNGWSLSKSLVFRDTNQTLSDRSDDIFYLVMGGATRRLVYIASESRYHPLHEDFTHIKQVNNTWMVKTKDGVTYKFGLTERSRLNSTLEPYTSLWYVEEIEDLHNNRISFGYLKNPSAEKGMYLSNISYSIHLIRFSYSFGAQNGFYGYAYGTKIEQTALLNNIEVQANNTLVRRYDFEYTTIDGKKFLNKLTEKGNDLTSLPPTEFTYYQNSKGWQPDTKWNIPDSAFFGSAFDNGTRLVDVNTDGFIDIIKSNPAATGYYWLGNKSGWANPTTFSGFPILLSSNGADKGVRFSDINGDAKIDFVQLASGVETIRAASLGTGTGFISYSGLSSIPAEVSFVNSYSETIPIGQRRVCETCLDSCPSYSDFDDDSYECDMATEECSWECVYYKCYIDGEGYTGDRYPRRSTCYYAGCDSCPSGERDEECDMDCYWETVYGTVTRYKDTGYILADVNGDGKSDIIKGTESERKTWIQSNEAWTENALWQIPSEAFFVTASGTDKGVRLVDVNSDGLLDIVKAEDAVSKTWLNTGKGWVLDTIWALPASAAITIAGKSNGIIFTDVNGDGFIDVLKAGVAKIALINNGRGWSSDTAWEAPSGLNSSDSSLRVSDINGDGMDDIVSAPTSISKTTYINQYPQQYLLKEVKTPLGGKTYLSYKKISDLDNTGTDEISDLGFSGWVVSSIKNNNGIAGVHNLTTSTTINYSDGFFDPVEREFRGFGKVQENIEGGPKINHYFYQDKARKGKEFNTEMFNQTNSLYLKKEFTYSNTTTDGYYIILLNNTKEYVYDGSPTAFVTQTDYSYDSYGNPIKVSSLGDIASSSDNFHDYFEYIYNTEKWILNTLKRYTRKNSADSIIVYEMLYSYDNQSYGAAPTKGDITLTQYNNNGTFISESASYDIFGNMVKETDANNHSTEYSYGPANLFVSNIKDALGMNTKVVTDLRTGNILSEQDPNGFSTKYEYDSFNRITKTIKPYDSILYPTVLNTYSFTGTAPSSITTEQREISGSSNVFTAKTYYDGFGNVIQVQVEDVNNNKTITNYVYDRLNRLSQKYLPISKSSVTSYAVPSSEAKYYTNFSYNIFGELIKQSNPDNSMMIIIYNKNIISVYDENYNRIDYIIDGNNNFLQVKEYDKSNIYATSFNYNALGDLVTISDNTGNISTIMYDQLGRITAMSDKDRGYWSYYYDNAGNLIRQIDAKGNQIILAYDPLHRLTNKSSGNISFSYVYDLEKNGTLSKEISPELNIIYSYDNRLRLNRKSHMYSDGNNLTVNYEYDAFDRVTKAAYPGRDLFYNYNERGLLSAVPGFISTGVFNPAGLLTRLTYDNGKVTNFIRNPASLRVTDIQTSPVQHLNYTYDLAGNILKITDVVHGTQKNMRYDPLHRLVHADQISGNTYSFDYSYDTIGNMVALNTTKQGVKFMYGKSGPLHSPVGINAK